MTTCAPCTHKAFCAAREMCRWSSIWPCRAEDWNDTEAWLVVLAIRMDEVYELHPDTGNKKEREAARALREPLLQPLRAECIAVHEYRIMLNQKELYEHTTCMAQAS